MKTIETLVEDIYDVLGNVPDHIRENAEEYADKFAARMKLLIKNRLLDTKPREPRLSISSIGKPCTRQTWLKIRYPEEAEPLKPEARIKFLYGDILEELLVFLAEVSGHKVEGVQEPREVEGVFGSSDVIIDGVLVDVKSASPASFKKFKERKLVDDDPFGYIGQIQTYLESAQDDPKVTDKDRCAFLVIDKTLGHICLDIHPKVDFDVKEVTRRVKAVIEGDKLPDRKYDPIPDGKSGNMALGVTCSYCDVKQLCHPGLRTFIYSTGPKFLTEVKKVPDVIEVNRKENL